VNLKIALLALVALVPGATAASITASPSPALTKPALTTEPAQTILSQFADPGFSAYDYLVIATPGVVISNPDAPSKIPAAAFFLSTTITLSFCAILLWQRWAVQPSHRVFSRRRKRILRKMSHI
jgi:hypothetical protein